MPSSSFFYLMTTTNIYTLSLHDALPISTTPASISTSQSPQGNWVGTYGATGYGLLGWNGPKDTRLLSTSISISFAEYTRNQWTTSAGTAVPDPHSADASSTRSTRPDDAD